MFGRGGGKGKLRQGDIKCNFILRQHVARKIINIFMENIQQNIHIICFILSRLEVKYREL